MSKDWRRHSDCEYPYPNSTDHDNGCSWEYRRYLPWTTLFKDENLHHRQVEQLNNSLAVSAGKRRGYLPYTENRNPLYKITPFISCLDSSEAKKNVSEAEIWAENILEHVLRRDRASITSIHKSERRQNQVHFSRPGSSFPFLPSRQKQAPWSP